MDRSESQFCRDEADRLLKLANECSDAKVRNHLHVMASEWLERAKAKEKLGERDLPKTAWTPGVVGEVNDDH